MKKLMIVGAHGQLGREICHTLNHRQSELGLLSEFYQDCEILALDHSDFDITDAAAVQSLIISQKPYAVINCAAFTNVDGCEDQKETAFKVNALGARNLAMACEAIDVKLLHVSTDYVFAGDADIPYVEWDLPSPRSAYGNSKLLGEQYIQQQCRRSFIIRTSWLYGYYGKNFVKTIAKLAQKQPEIQVVDDQRGNPTNAADLAYHILKLLPTEEYGIYHCTGQGECSWFDFACEIVKNYQIPCKVNPCSTAASLRKAKRPAYSSLDNMMLRITVGDDMRPWKDALKYFCAHYSLDLLNKEN